MSGIDLLLATGFVVCVMGSAATYFLGVRRERNRQRVRLAEAELRFSRALMRTAEAQLHQANEEMMDALMVRFYTEDITQPSDEVFV